MRQEGREISKWGWEDRRWKSSFFFFFILPHREMRELILRGLHLFFFLPLHLFLYFTTFAFWHALCFLILIFQSHIQKVLLCCHSTLAFGSLISVLFFEFAPQIFPIPPCRVYRFVMHGNLTANICLSLLMVQFFSLLPCRVPELIGCLYLYIWMKCIKSLMTQRLDREKLMKTA